MTNIVKTFWWRHGETEWNAQRKWQGHSDIPMNAKGIEQAERLAQRLQAVPLDFIVSSDLDRAWRTAGIVAKTLGLEVVGHEELREGHFGRAEGLTIDEIRRKFGCKLLEDWRSSSTDTLDIRFAGGESKREIIERVMSNVENTIHTNPFKSLGVSTHGGVLRKVLNFFAPQMRLPSPIPNCFCIQLNYHKKERLWQHVPLELPPA